ncbi:MAG: amino acid-binding protein, partial [Dehalococcoidales bacterium]|nr:amino acid-binding protein [Dehalococcoidales bacterium]
MKIKQISVFAENKPGRLMEILKVIEAEKINLSAISVAETDEFGIVRMVMNNTDAGAAALKAAGFTVRVDDLICATAPDVEGGLLNSIIKPLAAEGINIDYFYTYLDKAPGLAQI